MHRPTAMSLALPNSTKAEVCTSFKTGGSRRGDRLCNFLVALHGSGEQEYLVTWKGPGGHTSGHTRSPVIAYRQGSRKASALQPHEPAFSARRRGRRSRRCRCRPKGRARTPARKGGAESGQSAPCAPPCCVHIHTTQPMNTPFGQSRTSTVRVTVALPPPASQTHKSA